MGLFLPSRTPRGRCHTAPGRKRAHPGAGAQPLTFSFVNASIYHPACLYESRQVHEMPSFVRDVTIPEFDPRAWRGFIDTKAKVLHAGEGTRPGNVIDHFSLFITSYLPAIDAAGGGDGLIQLPAR